MLEELFSDTGLLYNDIEFRPGINIVLGKYARNKQESGINGIGKSSLVRLIDYALLSDGAERLFSQEKYNFLREEDHSITLKLKLGKDSHYIRRTFGKKRSIIGFGTNPNHLVEYELRELRLLLLNKMFPIVDEAVRYEGDRFRTLFNFFIKDDLDQRLRKDPLDFFPYQVSIQEKYAYNFFLLGLPNSAQFQYGSYIKRYRETAAHAKELKERIQVSTGKKIEEFKSERVVLEQRVSLLEKNLRDYRFLERYKNIERELSAINDQINERLKNFHSLSRKLKRLRVLSINNNDIDLSDVSAMYDELSSTFASLVTKKLEDIITFKKSLIENRVRYNLEREHQIDASIREVEGNIITLENHRAQLLRQLDEKGELDSITNTYEELVSEKLALEKNVQLLRQIDDANEEMQRIDIQISEEKVAIYQSIKQSESKLDDLRTLFREIVNNAILSDDDQDVSAYFDVSATSGGRRTQLPFNVEIEVPKSDALGRFNLKLVAYDLLVFLNAVRTERKLPRFLVHDGVFHGVARRTMVGALNYIHRQSFLYPGFQYIVTFNEDELYISEERKYIDGNFAFDLDDVTIARFTDSEAQMIFRRAFG